MAHLFGDFCRLGKNGEKRLNGSLSPEELGIEFSFRSTKVWGLLVDQEAQPRVSGK